MRARLILGFVLLAACQSGGNVAVTGQQKALADADALFRARKYEEARAAYEAVAESASDASVRVEALAQIARCYSIQKRDAEGKPWLERAAALASENDPLGWSRYLIVRGVYEREADERDKAQKTFLACYEFCMAKRLFERAIDATHHLAIAAPREQQIEWAKLGIAAAEKGGYDQWLAVLWNNLGWTYDDLERYPEALDALGKARKYHHKIGSERSKLVADWSFAHAQRMVGNLQAAKMMLDATLATAKARFAAEPSNDTREWVGQCYWELGEVTAAHGDRTEGLRLLKQARTELVAAGIEKWWRKGLEKLDARIAELGG